MCRLDAWETLSLPSRTRQGAFERLARLRCSCYTATASLAVSSILTAAIHCTTSFYGTVTHGPLDALMQRNLIPPVRV